MTFIIAPIVEGHGDVAAVPVLLRRMAPMLLVRRPVRFPRSRLLQEEHLSRAARIAEANIDEDGAVLLVLDADDDCAATLGPELESKLQSAIPNRICRTALAVREFEAWIVGGITTYNTIDPDSTGNLKGLIRDRLGVYGETADQARLIASADLEVLEQRSRSFRRLCKVVRELEQIANQASS